MALDPALAERILRAVEDGFAEQVAHARALARVPSTRGGEHAIQDFVHRTVRDRGLAMGRVAMDPAARARRPGGASVSPAR